MSTKEMRVGMISFDLPIAASVSGAGRAPPPRRCSARWCRTDSWRPAPRPFCVSALKSVDLPTLGRPTMPHLKPMIVRSCAGFVCFPPKSFFSIAAIGPDSGSVGGRLWAARLPDMALAASGRQRFPATVSRRCSGAERTRFMKPLSSSWQADRHSSAMASSSGSSHSRSALAKSPST